MDLSAPHSEINEDGIKVYHSGYFEKVCLACKKPFLVANHVAAKFEDCAKCSGEKET